MTTLTTPIVTTAGASKPYLPIIAPAITIMASGACGTPLKMVIVAVTTTAVVVTAMPSIVLSMLATAIRPTITTSPSSLLVSRAMASHTPHRAIGHVPAHARIVAITEYYISASFRPVKAIAAASQTGHATNIITGLAVSLQATALPVAVIAAGICIAYSAGGGLYDHGMEYEEGIEQP